jgi:hypothetical protein
LGVPLSEKKRAAAGPLQVVLGYEVNSSSRQFGLTKNRRNILTGILDQLRNKKHLIQARRNVLVSKRELEGILGLLHRAQVLVPILRYYTIRLQLAMVRSTWFEVEKRICNWKNKGRKGTKPGWSDVSSREVKVPLNPLLMSDIERIYLFLKTWTGFVNWPTIFFDQTPRTYLTIASCGSDASGEGFGAVHEDLWIAGPWSELEKQTAKSTTGLNIAYLELLAFYKLLTHLTDLNRLPATNQLIVAIDNQSVVTALNHGHSTSSDIGAILSDIATICIAKNINIEAIWIETDRNVICDDLSRVFTQCHDCTCSIDLSMNRLHTPTCKKQWERTLVQVAKKHNLNGHNGSLILTANERITIHQIQTNDYLKD